MDEYISREIAIERIKYKKPKVLYSEYGVGYERGLEDAIGLLNAIPATDVQPVKQWVKLHDKHPDTEGSYLVCDQYGECEVAEYLPDIKSWFTHKIKGEIWYWMPIPEPPKDGDTEEGDAE